ncbi:ribonuclease kappa-B-like protein, partial [Leptotrombidium deliense]
VWPHSSFRTVFVSTMPICGPKCSICCSLISIWGVIMLSILGGLLYIKSLAFVDDMEGGLEKENDTLHALDQRYEQSAYGCWFATGLYVLTFLFSLQQYYANKKIQSI